MEGNKAMRFLLHTILNKHYDVVSVPDGVSAIYSLRRNNDFSLIVMDPHVHDMPGWELVKYLKHSALYHDIPIVILSSMDENQLKSNAMKYSVEQFFSKPFNPLKFIESVDEWVMGDKVTVK